MGQHMFLMKKNDITWMFSYLEYVCCMTYGNKEDSIIKPIKTD